MRCFVFINVFVFIFFSWSDSYSLGRTYANQKEILNSQMKYLDLPDYCQQRLLERDVREVLGKELPEPYLSGSRLWSNKIGPNNWVYFHHFCWGISKTQEALAKVGKSRSDEQYFRLLKSAQSEFTFMKNRAGSNFPLWGVLNTYEKYISDALHTK